VLSTALLAIEQILALNMKPEDFISIVKTHQNIPIVLYQEIYNPSIESIDLFFDYVEHLTNKNKFYFIVDLSLAKPPNAEIRALLKSRYKMLEENIISTHVYIGTNFLLKIAVKFLAASVGINEFKISKSILTSTKSIINEN